MDQEQIKKDINFLELMLINITKFFENKMHIYMVMGNLKSYVNHLNIVDEEFESAFFKIWEDIEIIYAFTMEKKLEELTCEDNIKVEALLCILQKIVNTRLGDVKKLL